MLPRVRFRRAQMTGTLTSAVFRHSFSDPCKRPAPSATDLSSLSHLSPQHAVPYLSTHGLSTVPISARTSQHAVPYLSTQSRPLPRAPLRPKTGPTLAESLSVGVVGPRQSSSAAVRWRYRLSGGGDRGEDGGGGGGVGSDGSMRKMEDRCPSWDGDGSGRPELAGLYLLPVSSGCGRN